MKGQKICILVGGDIVHLFAMVGNDPMALTVAGSDEQTWITYFDEYSFREGVVLAGKEGSLCW